MAARQVLKWLVRLLNLSAAHSLQIARMRPRTLMCISLKLEREFFLLFCAEYALKLGELLREQEAVERAMGR